MSVGVGTGVRVGVGAGVEVGNTVGTGLGARVGIWVGRAVRVGAGVRVGVATTVTVAVGVASSSGMGTTFNSESPQPRPQAKAPKITARQVTIARLRSLLLPDLSLRGLPYLCALSKFLISSGVEPGAKVGSGLCSWDLLAPSPRCKCSSTCLRSSSVLCLLLL